MTTALYAGSFDPFTIGHLSIADRALRLFDCLVIGIGVNQLKRGAVSPEERRNSIAEIFADNPRVKVVVYSGLTADLAAECGASVLVRGVRSVADFEAERELADINRTISGIDTVLLPALPELAFVSSSMVRELTNFGHDASRFVARPHNNLSTQTNL